MTAAPGASRPQRSSYDVVIIGGALMGSAAAWFLTSNPDFDGTVLVVERDPSYEFASTSRTNSCMRQQFSNELNIRISQFAADYVRDFPTHMGDDPEVPELAVQHFGYMYLADTAAAAADLTHKQRLQASWGVATRLMTPTEIRQEYPFYNVDDIVLGSINVVDEGYFDSGTMFDWWRRKARRNGAEYLHAEATAVELSSAPGAVVTLASGERVSCGVVVNAAGPRAAQVAACAGLTLPVEPRKRFTWIFSAREPLERDLPLTIDPSGVHVRSEGATAYLAGCRPDPDPAAAFDDFEMDHDLWEDRVWPTLAHRIPEFEQIKVTNRWVGHYAFNTLDHNVIIGPHPEHPSFIYMCGFSGHGTQQSPAIGRGVAELITYGGYRSLDLSPLGFQRILANEPFIETAVI